MTARQLVWKPDEKKMRNVGSQQISSLRRVTRILHHTDQPLIPSLVGSSTTLLDERGSHGGVQVRAGRSGVCSSCVGIVVAVGAVFFFVSARTAGRCPMQCIAKTKSSSLFRYFSANFHPKCVKCSVSARPHVSARSPVAPNTSSDCSAFDSLRCPAAQRDGSLMLYVYSDAVGWDRLSSTRLLRLSRGDSERDKRQSSSLVIEMNRFFCCRESRRDRRA